MSVLFNWNSIITAFSNDPLRRERAQQGPSSEPQQQYGPGHLSLDALVDEFNPAAAPWSWRDRFTGTAILLGTAWTLFFWFYLRKKSQSEHSPRMRLQYGETTKPPENQSEFQKFLLQRVEAVEQQVLKASQDHLDTIEKEIRTGLNKRVDALETKIKLDQDAIEDMHRALNQRMEALEECIRTIDSKQLDMEATHIVQRGLSQRLEAVEGSLQSISNKTRSSTQRIESMDDSVRVIDSRSKALSQRVEAVEDSIGTIDGQTTLLSHDLSRGSLSIEKMQRQVKLLPDAEKFKGLSRAWDTRFKKIEAKIEQYRTTLEETLAERQETNLTLSPMDSQEIEPSGAYADLSGSYEYAMVSPSPSTRSQSSCSRPGTYSTVSSSPPSMIPMTPERRRLDMAGFREMTFSSKQKQLLPRHSFTK